MRMKMSTRTAFRVISVKGSPRRDTFHRPSENADIDWDFLDASTGLAEGLNFDARLSCRHMRRRLAPAEVGCYGSHVRAWRELLGNSSLSQMVVLEDDVFADWPFLLKTSHIEWSKLGVNYLKFYVKYPARFRVVSWSSPIKDRHLVQYTTLALGTQAYLISPWAAERFERTFRNVSRPIDIQMDRPWSTGVPVMGMVPVAALELSVASSIPHREKSDMSRIDTLRYFAGRLAEHTRAKSYELFGPTAKLNRHEEAV